MAEARRQSHEHSPAGGARSEPPLRRPACPRSGQLRRAARRDLRPDRPQRRRQNHPVQPDLRRHAPHRWSGALVWCRHHRPGAPSAQPPRPGPHLPEPAPIRWPLGARQPAGGAAAPPPQQRHRGPTGHRRPPTCRAPAARHRLAAAGGAGASSHGRASSRHPGLRRSAPTGDGPRPGHAPAAAATG